MKSFQDGLSLLESLEVGAELGNLDASCLIELKNALACKYPMSTCFAGTPPKDTEITAVNSPDQLAHATQNGFLDTPSPEKSPITNCNGIDITCEDSDSRKAEVATKYGSLANGTAAPTEKAA